MKIRIQVTAEDIAKGRDGDSRCHTCPIALALKRATGAEVVTVGGFWDGRKRMWRADRKVGLLSNRASRFVTRFDAGKPVKPATFILKDVST